MAFILSISSKLVALAMALVTFVGGFVSPVKPFSPSVEIPSPEKECEMMAIIENGQSSYVIVCGKAPGDPEYTAALKLQSYLKQISGAELPIVPDTTQVSDCEIIVGKTAREGSVINIDRSSFGDETLNVFTEGKRLVIAGGEKRGTLYSVYEFLTQYLDCRWFTSELIEIPKSSTVEIPKVFSLRFTPTLEYRETDWISPKNIEYSLANHLNSNIYRSLSPENGGFMGYAGNFAHTLANSFIAPSQYFESHPEYYALRGGERVPKQLCLTNPDVRSLLVQQVRAQLLSHPDCQIISLTQHDNQEYCQCDACSALDEREGSHAGTMIDCVNYVAAALEEEFPDVAFDTFAYQYTRKPPKSIKPRDNVIVRLCSIECCFAHPLNDGSCPENVEFCSDLEGWSKICKRLYVWDYTTNYSNYLGPFPNFGVMQENMRFFVKNNVVGIYEEGNYTAGQCNAEFAELRAYLLSRLLFDPDCDYDKEMNSFLKAYYGDGWQYIREYIDVTTTHTGTGGRHMKIYQNMFEGNVLDLTPMEIRYCDDLWQNAKVLATTDKQLENVLKSELSWRYWQACNMVSEFSRVQAPWAWKNANKALADDYRRFGVVRYNEGKMLAAEPDIGEIPTHWHTDWEK